MYITQQIYYSFATNWQYWNIWEENQWLVQWGLPYHFQTSCVDLMGVFAGLSSWPFNTWERVRKKRNFAGTYIEKKSYGTMYFFLWMPINKIFYYQANFLILTFCKAIFLFYKKPFRYQMVNNDITAKCMNYNSFLSKLSTPHYHRKYTCIAQSTRIN